MAKKQSRRTFSVSRSTYDAAMRAAADAGVSCSEWVTELIRERVPDMLPQQTHVRPASESAPSHTVGPTYRRSSHTEPPRVTREQLDEMAAARAAARNPRPGTLCANCVEAPATHYGHVDHESGLYALCDECEFPAEERHGVERGYEPSGELPTLAETKRAARRAMGDARYDRDSEIKKRLDLSPAPPSALKPDSYFETRQVVNSRRGGLRRRR